MTMTPETIEQLTAILANANEGKQGVSWSGRSISAEELEIDGLLHLDLSRMNQIVKINSAARYVVVESGVTWRQLSLYLKQFPSLRSVQVPSSMGKTVIASCLSNAIHDSCTIYGTLGEWVNGMEVILADGSVIQIGAQSLVKDSWFNIGPLPDLKGLLIQGGGWLGVVSKLSLKLLPCAQYEGESCLVLKNPEDCMKWIYCITHQEIADYVHCFYHSEPNYLKKTYFIGVVLRANSKKEWEYKKQALAHLVQEERGVFYQETLPEAILYRACNMELLYKEPQELLYRLSPQNAVQAIIRLKDTLQQQKAPFVLDFSVVDHNHQSLIRIAWEGVSTTKEEMNLLVKQGLDSLIYTPWSSFGIPEKNRVLAERIQDKFDPKGVLKRMYL